MTSTLKHGRISRVCVAVDASDASESAARMAISIVHGNRHAELDFCHVINIPRMVARADRSLDNYGLSFEVAQENANVVLARCCDLAHDAGVFARSYVRFGNPAEEVQSFAQGLGADLVVIGNRPAGKIQRVLNGSVRDEIVRTCPLPILITANETSASVDFRPHCIVVAGADAPTAIRAKRLAADLAADYFSQLVLLRAASDGSRQEKQSIDRAVEEHRPGLIVMTCSRSRRIRNIFAEDVVERVMQEADVPVLVVRAEESNVLR
jgi:nucleotide-binding universal stress UspA family protein